MTVDFTCHLCGRESTAEHFEDIKKVGREQIFKDLFRYPICGECYNSLEHYECPKCHNEMINIYDGIRHDWNSHFGCECGQRIYGTLNLKVIKR